METVRRAQSTKMSIVGSFLHLILIASCIATVGCFNSSINGDSQSIDSNSENGGGGQEDNPNFFAELKDGDIVAKLAIEDKAIPKDGSALLLRGTVPIPPFGFGDNINDGKVPFAVVDPSGKIYPAQHEAVSYYADIDREGADVVELLTKVEVDPSASGDQVYDVIYSPHDSVAKPTMTDAPSLLKSTPGLLGEMKDDLENGAIKIYATDADGNRYGIDNLLGGHVKLMGWGPYRTTVRTYNRMQLIQRNSNPPSGCNAYENLFGVHAYFASYDGKRYIDLGLRFHNGPANIGGQDPPIGDVFFDKIEIWVKKGSTVVNMIANPNFDNSNLGNNPDYNIITLVTPEEGGKYNFFPKRFRFVRRLALVKQGDEASAIAHLRGEGFAAPVPELLSPDTGLELFSFAALATARYLATKHRMPYLGSFKQEIRDYYAARLGNENQSGSYLWHVANGLKNGTKFSEDIMGTFFPPGAKHGGQTGGTGIHTHPYWDALAAASKDAFFYMMVEHMVHGDRMPDSIYRDNGEPTAVEQWLVNNYVPFSFYQKPKSGDPMGDNDVDTCQRDYVVYDSGKHPWYCTPNTDPNKPPGCLGTLNAFDPHDIQHHRRWTSHIAALTFGANDPIARDDLYKAGEIARFSYHQYPGKGTTIYNRLQEANEHPGRGFFSGRDDGWAMNTAAEALSTNSDPKIRKRFTAFFWHVGRSA